MKKTGIIEDNRMVPPGGFNSTKRGGGKPPPGVINLTATPDSPTMITLSWTTSGTVTAPYKVYKNGIIVTSTSNKYFSVSSLTASTSYNFQVISSDSKQVKSNIVTASTLAGTGSGDSVVFLDFNGTTINGTSWAFNNQVFSGSGLSSTEIAVVLAGVQAAFAEIAPGLVITTDESLFDAANIYKRQKVVITESHEWYCGSSTPCASGVTRLGSFTLGDASPLFVFSTALYYNTDYIIRTTVHEVGHSMGLLHVVDYCGSQWFSGGDWMSISGSFGREGSFGTSVMNVQCVIVDEQAVIQSKV